MERRIDNLIWKHLLFGTQLAIKQSLVHMFIHGNTILKCLFDPDSTDIEKVVLYWHII